MPGRVIRPGPPGVWPENALARRFALPARTPPNASATAEVANWQIGTTPRSVSTSVSWNTGDVIIVHGGIADLSQTLNTPTVTGLTFALVASAAGASNSCRSYLWAATAASSGSGTVQGSASDNIVPWGIAVEVWTGTDGVGNSATDATTAKTVNLTRSANNSGVSYGGFDWSASSAAATWTPTGQTIIESSGDDTNYGIHVGYWGDQGPAGTTSYGISSASTGAFAKVAVEILGKAAVGVDVNVDGDLATTATIDGTAAVDRTVNGDRTITATIDGSIDVIPPTIEIDGSLTVTATITGTATVDRTIDGTRATTATIDGTANSDRTVQGDLSVTATASGTSNVDRAVAGSLAVTATITGSIDVIQPGQVNVDGTRPVTATITGAGATTHTIDGATTTTTTLSGTINVAAAVAGNLQTQALITGSVDVAGAYQPATIGPDGTLTTAGITEGALQDGGADGTLTGGSRDGTLTGHITDGTLTTTGSTG